MKNLGWVDPRVEQVRAADVRSYMLRHGWKLRPHKRPEALVFGGVLDDDGKEIIQVIAASEQAPDYLLRVVQLIDSLSVFEDRPCVAILNDILAQNAAPSEVNGDAEGGARKARRGAR
jgi:hypothetical protein